MQQAPQGLRLHIGIFGRRNVGKSSLLNALTGQEAAIVSPVPGTTTDVVSKPMELKPFGPVLFLDTAGVDDVGELGKLRVAQSLAALDRTDVALILTDAFWGEFEEAIARDLLQRKIPWVAVFSKCDLKPALLEPGAAGMRPGADPVLVSAKTGEGLDRLRQAILSKAPQDVLDQPPILADLIGPGDTVVLVVPIDLEAPKGRLILPQVQVIREILDHDGCALVVKERELADTLARLKQPPRLVVTDSQVMLKVAGDTPAAIPMTSFSVLFARWKGDLETFVRGVAAVDALTAGDRILILESCTHHPIGDDIGRVKIPRWLMQYSGADLRFEVCAGHDLPANLGEFALVIQCGACMTNRREVLSRILAARVAGVPITNYGLVIAKSQGLLARIVSPFPEMSEILLPRTDSLPFQTKV